MRKLLSTHYVEQLVGVLVVWSLVQRTVDVGEPGPVSAQIVRHHVDGVHQPVGKKSIISSNPTYSYLTKINFLIQFIASRP